MCATSHQHLLPGQQCLAAPLRTQCQYGTKASPRSGPCYSVARIGLPPACRFHRIGGGPGDCSVLTHRATVSSACCCARPRRRMAPRWRPASPSAPSTPGEWTNWRGAAATQPVPSGDSSCTGAVHCTEPYCRRDHKTQPASVVGQGQEDSSPWGWCWLVGRRPLVPGIMSTSRHRLRHLGARRSEQRGRLEAVSPEPACPNRQGQPFAGPQTRPSQSAIPVPGPGTNGTEPSAHRIARPHALHHLNRRRVRAVPAATDVAMDRRVIWALGRPGQQKRKKRNRRGGESGYLSPARFPLPKRGVMWRWSRHGILAD